MAGLPATLVLGVEGAFSRNTTGLFEPGPMTLLACLLNLCAYDNCCCCCCYCCDYYYNNYPRAFTLTKRRQLGNFLTTWCFCIFVLRSDTQKFAFKCSFITYADEAGELTDREVFKSPIDQPMKKSKKGRLTLHKLDGSQGEKVDAVLAADNDTTKCVYPIFCGIAKQLNVLACAAGSAINARFAYYLCTIMRQVHQGSMRNRQWLRDDAKWSG